MLDFANVFTLPARAWKPLTFDPFTALFLRPTRIVLSFVSRKLLSAALHILGLVLLLAAHFPERKTALCHYRPPPIGRAGDLIDAFLPPTRAVKDTVLNPLGVDGVGAAGVGLEFTRALSLAAGRNPAFHRSAASRISTALRRDQRDTLTAATAETARHRGLHARFTRCGVEV